MGGSNLQYVSKYISRSKFIFTILEHDIYINELDDDVKLSGPDGFSNEFPKLFWPKLR